MVGLFKALLAPLLLAAFVVAQDATFSITYPSANDWWVAQSSDVMAWNCTDPVAVSYGHWTVYINNTSPSVFTGPLGIIAELQNADCSYSVSHDQVNLPVGTGYYVIFANDINSTKVYAISQPFEVKALGSPYPITSSASAASGTAAASSSASATAGSKNAAAHSSHCPSLLVLTGILGLLTTGLLGVLS